MPEDETFRELIHINNPVPDGLYLSIVDEAACGELGVDGGAREDANHHYLLIVLDYDWSSHHCLPHIDVHPQALLLADVSVGVDKLAYHHFLVLLRQGIKLVLIVVPNYLVLSVSIVITQ